MANVTVREPQTIVAQAARILDFTQPVAVLLLAVLHFIPDAEDPLGIVATLAGALAPGSYLVISHLTGDFAAEQVAAAAYNTLVPLPVTSAAPMPRSLGCLAGCRCWRRG